MNSAPTRYGTDVGYEVLMDAAPVECAIPYARYGAVTMCRPQALLGRLLHAVDSICEQKRTTVLRLAGGVREKSRQKFRQ